ncbi:serine/threonine-protein kinase [Actinomadura fibrosa]|uniref:Protein kinase n=2 Tax=Actinomadura fibrosa TaxID=111802 RepID=A0ABW2Y2U1_9ACTN
MDPLGPDAPRKIGRYLLSARLGAGGMGEVFFGRSPGGRPVAVKLIRSGYAADAEFRRRFRREVEAARKVGGFHTAQVVDADPDPGTGPPWMVTAYVPGPSLARVLAEHGPLPTRTLRVLGAGLAEALEAIHAAGLIHRDLKPSNILLADDGPRVIDFGISRAADASGCTGRVGTPGFMSPELLTGEPLTMACDVFSFGLVLAHAAGVRPFGEGPEQALNFRIVHQEPDLTGIDGELAGLAGSCLAKNPADRPTPAQIIDVLADHAPTGDWLPFPVQTMIAQRAAPPAERTPSGASPPGAEHHPVPTTTYAAADHTPPIARRRSALLPLALSGVLVLGVASGLYLLERRPWSSGTRTPSPSGGQAALAAYSARRPGCDDNVSAVSWRRVGISSFWCVAGGTRMSKLQSWNGRIAENNAELRFTPTDRTFPSRYRLSVDVTALNDTDPTAQGACAGFATHTNEAGSTFEELSVCSSGKSALIKVSNGVEISRDEEPLLPAGEGPFTLRAEVTPDKTTFTVRAADGDSSSLETTAVASTTSHIGLTIFWKSNDASATFSNFNYQPQ